MALGDFTPLAIPGSSALPSRPHQVASGTTASINAGEPVAKTLGSQYVATLAANKPVVGTDYLSGVSTTTSTETASAAGSVDVAPISSSDIWLVAPKVPATFGQGTTQNQATYNSLVGARVLLDKTGGVYTILAADSANNGCVVEDMNVVTNPGKVAFSFRGGLSYLA